MRRIVDRYLEHARVFRFECGGEPEFYLSSADWMPRNLNGRIEVAFPLLDPAQRARVQEMLDVQLADTEKAREVQPDGSSQRVQVVGAPLRSQQHLMELTRARGRTAPSQDPDRFFEGG